jgi:hypothetical protein
LKYRITNWAEHQHYKDRNPPWIKLKVDILSSQDWVMWNDASRTLAIACMVLASKTGGQIDGSPAGLAYLKRAAYLNVPPNLKPLIESGFLTPLADASAVLADASTSVSVSESESVSSSGERGVGKGAIVIPDDLKDDAQLISDWLDYKRQRGETYKAGKGVEALWRAVRAIPADKRREAVDHSMSNNYAGLFQKNGGSNGNQNGGRSNGGSNRTPEEAPGKFDGISQEITV